MKKGETVRFRMDDKSRDLLQKACDSANVKMSFAIRDLCVAAIDYVNKYKTWPKQAVITDGGETRDIPVKWISIALLKVKSLEEMKDVILTIMLNVPLEWDSDFGPHADHTKEVTSAIDARLKELRSQK